ncbi:probable ATP-dependent RNA helicase DDX10 [Mytilus trossulus]|uniref:probable ATP-dependent RNA helicase DDX10 n=1 Tax=Mytilus trossulus TaxID=6551 RepID=UPI003007E079
MKKNTNTRFMFGGQDRPRKDNFKGRSGEKRKKQLLSIKERKVDSLNKEIADIRSRYAQIEPSKISSFTDFPLSKRTLEGLRIAKFASPTDIQRESIGLALKGNDVLGAAKTGSGKTLAFLIPVLECLFREKWSHMDGLGALIISPTRELAYQTFEVLKRVGNRHDFSAGLVIGGKHLREETVRLNRTNIVICTPGRLLQHMDETFNFTADSLQILVLDEADRILDMGFAQSMNAIIENLPSERQTLLFSATQTKSIKDLARLSLNNPVYVSVHENAAHSTPTQLEQSYIVCELHDKMNILWSFVKNHLKSKVLIFMSSCKQVKFIFECFRRFRPGVTVLCLHGGMNQLKRVAAYREFCRKKHAVLFATDIAARGLDFPAVNWVIQMDCPEDANTYIHRAGRTARYEKGGEAMLLLLPSEEEAMVQHLKDKKIPVECIKVNSKKIWSIQNKLESNCAADPHLKEMAQRAFLGYLRSVFLMSDKKVFNVHKLDIEEYSRSLGLAIAPKVRFLKRDQKRLEEKAAKIKKKIKDKQVEESESEDLSESESRLHPEIASGSESESESDGDIASENDSDQSEQSESESENSHVTKNKSKQEMNFDVDEDDVDDLFTVKRVELEDDSEEELEKSEKKEKILSKAALAKKLSKQKITVNTKIQFDDEGEEIEDKLKKPVVKKTFEDDEDEGGINIQVARQRMMEEDKFDKQLFRERIKQKHKEERIKKKEKNREKKKKNDDNDEDQDDEEGVPFEGTEDTDQLIAELPDPDKIYGRESGEEDNSDEEESDDEGPRKKAKFDSNSDEDSESEYNSEKDSGENEEDSDEDSVTMDTGLSIEGDEELALKLLNS